ncbi:MAG: M48 family metalloprotease [Saprospiraceae bacterium]|nr:M48 family metalloprotease [Saprospiraceae bacterium]
METLIMPGLQKFFYALSWTFLHSLWQCTVIALIAGILTLFLRKTKAGVKYSIWIVSLLLFLAINFATFNNQLQLFQSQEIKVSVQLDESTAAESEASSVIVQTTTDSRGKAVQNIVGGINSYVNKNIYPIILVWFIGMLFMLFKFMGGLSYLYYIKYNKNFRVDEYWDETLTKLQASSNIKRNIQLVESSIVNTVMVIGHLKPIILFPIGLINKLDPRDVEGILAHEIAHIKRNDFLINLMQSLLEVIYYFNPAIWYISNKIREEREVCCDEYAVSMCGDSLQYAKSLVLLGDIQQATPKLGLSAIGSNKYQLLNRVQRMLGSEKYTQSLFERMSVAVGILIFILFFALNSLLNAKDPIKSDVNLTTINHLTKIDSFLLAKKVSDGTYTYQDHNLTSEITVKENRVVKLKFNGVELSPDDFPKFEKYFYNIIANHYKPETTTRISSTKDNNLPIVTNSTSSGIGTSRNSFSANHSPSKGIAIISNGNKIKVEDYLDLEPGTHTITNKDGYKTVIVKYDDGEMLIQEYKDNKLIQEYNKGIDDYDTGYTYSYNDYIQASGDYNQFLEEKKEYLELISNLRNELKEYSTNQKDRLNSKKKLTKDLEKLHENIKKSLKDNDELSNELAKSYCQLKNTIRQLVDKGYYYVDQNGNWQMHGGQNNSWNGYGNGASINNSRGSHSNYQSEEDKEWKSKMIKELEDDGYIDENESIKFRWEKGVMKINSNKISDKDHNKYVKIYEKAFDTKVKNEKEFSYFWNETRED